MHSTRKLDDGYLGSGTQLWHSIRKYGKENHKIEILEFFENQKELAKAEELLITEDLLKDPMCMNLKCGGRGGMQGLSKGTIKKISEAGQLGLKTKLKTDFDLREKFRLNGLRSIAILKSKGIRGSGFLNKRHTDIVKQKISETNSAKQRGDKNSQFGTVWITNGTENKKIKKESLIPDGWKRGRNLVCPKGK